MNFTSKCSRQRTMKQTYRKADEAEIKIYQSLWKNTLLAILCLAFAVVGYMIIRDDGDDLMTKVLGGWLNIVFFGGGGLFVLIVTLYNRIRHIPFLIIYEDRLKFYVQSKGIYYTVRFADVERFRLTKVSSSKMIAIDYKVTPLIHKMEESSGFVQKMMEFNIEVTGAIENIPVNHLTMKVKEIYSLLNKRLKKTHNTSE